MQVPVEITFRDMQRSEATEILIREKISKLEQICSYMISCRVIIEKPQVRQRGGSAYRFRIDIRVPPHHEIVARHEPGRGDVHQDLPEIIRDTFDAARRQLQELVEKQRGETKSHPTNEANGVIDKIFADSGYGFIKSIDGRDIFFHENSVLDGFERLRIGTGVRYVEEAGAEGPQASTVQIMDQKPGSKIV